MIISKQIEVDYSHRVPNHESACFRIHGHRGRIVAFLEGDLITKEGESSEGMVYDFKYIKKIMMEEIHDKLDHHGIYYEEDKLAKLMALAQIKSEKDLGFIFVPFIPTAENLAKYCFELIEPKLIDQYETGLKLKAIEFWETPTSCARFEK